jgi:hypothetical protein
LLFTYGSVGVLNTGPHDAAMSRRERNVGVPALESGTDPDILKRCVLEG